MKKLILFLNLSLLFTLSITAQVDTEDNNRFEFQDSYEFATGKNHDTKSILKLTTNGNIINGNNFRLSFEQKLNNSLSISGGINGETYRNPIFSGSHSVFIDGDTLPVVSFPQLVGFQRAFKLDAFLEGRYYLNQNYLIANGFGNNVNGFYAVVGAIAPFYDGGGLDGFDLSTYLGVGVQSRILKNGILDFSVLMDYNGSGITLSPRVQAGFAISKNYKNLEFNNARCNILKCFEERNFHFKIPLNNFLSLNYVPRARFGSVSVNPRIGFEHRLLQGLSFNHTLGYSQIFFVNTRNGVGTSRFGANYGYGNNLRWYILKRRNIAKGKSADNLTGIYAETSVSFFESRNLSSEEPQELNYKLRHFSYGLNLGYQTRLFKNLYIDFQGYFRETNLNGKVVKPGVLIPFADGTFQSYGLSLEVGFLF